MRNSSEPTDTSEKAGSAVQNQGLLPPERQDHGPCRTMTLASRCWPKSASGSEAFQIDPPLGQATFRSRRAQNKGQDEMNQSRAASTGPPAPSGRTEPLVKFEDLLGYVVALEAYFAA